MTLKIYQLTIAKSVLTQSLITNYAYTLAFHLEISRKIAKLHSM